MDRRPSSEGALRAFFIVELLRSTGEKEFPAQLMSVFFWIASHNGCKQEDLVKRCNLSPSSVSRCVTWLGPQHRLEHRSGLKLIRREQDPDNYKAWRLYLTPKGQIFTQLLEQYVSGSVPSLDQFTYDKESIEDESGSNDQDLGTGT